MIFRGVMKRPGGKGRPPSVCTNRRRCRRRGDKQERRGVAALEMAVVSPLFFMLILGMIEFGSAMLAKQAITNAAREGARIAVLPDGTVDRTDVYVRSVLQAAGINPASATIAISDEAGNTLDPTLAKFGDVIMVQVSLPFSQVSWVPVPKYLGNTILSSATVMRCERTQ